MARKRVTQIFPWLLPLRKRQRLLFFYAQMRMDKNNYACDRIKHNLRHLMFETSCPLYNKDTGADMIYQENKVFNLKLVVATMNKLAIRPGETFSYYQLARYADRNTPYKEGLIVVNGKLVTIPGGGVCQISNLLFWMFLHSPLTIVERHGHEVKHFPEPASDALIGVDAAVTEGWMDLKVRNETRDTFQIDISFDEENIIGKLYANEDLGYSCQVENGEVSYCDEGGKIFQEVDVKRKLIDNQTGNCISTQKLYRNRCQITYKLPPETKIERKR